MRGESPSSDSVELAPPPRTLLWAGVPLEESMARREKDQLEDLAMVRAIEEGKASPLVTRDQIFELLNGQDPSASKMRGFARRFRKPRLTEEVMAEFREGEG